MSGSRIVLTEARTRTLSWCALVLLLAGLCPPSVGAIEVPDAAASLGNEPHHVHARHAACCQQDCCSVALRFGAKADARMVLLERATAITADPGVAIGTRPHPGETEASPPGPPGLATPLLR